MSQMARSVLLCFPARNILYSSISAVISSTCDFRFFFNAGVNCLQGYVLCIQCVPLHYFIGLVEDFFYPCLIHLARFCCAFTLLYRSSWRRQLPLIILARFCFLSSFLRSFTRSIPEISLMLSEEAYSSEWLAMQYTDDIDVNIFVFLVCW